MNKKSKDLEKKEKKLRESEERYRRLFKTAQDGMLILNAETGEIKDANPYIQDLLGYSKEELVGRELWEIGTFKTIVENRDRFEELVDKGYIRYEDLPLETKEGKEAPVEFVSNTYEAGGEKVVQCNIRDISERKEVKKRLREERDRTQKYLDVAGAIIVAIDKNRKVVEINQQGCEILGYDKEEVIGKDWFENFVPERVRKNVAENTYKNLLDGKVNKRKTYENPILTKDGEERTIVWKNNVLRNDSGEIIETVSSGTDITERKKAEEKLESFVNAIPDLVFVLDEEGYYEEILTSQHDLLYDSKEELVGKRINKVLPGEVGEGMLNFVQRTIGSDEVQKMEYPLKLEGEKHWFEARALSIEREKSSEKVVSIIRDITEQKKAEQNLRESERQLEAILNDPETFIAITDTDGTLTEINEAAIDFIGIDPSDVKGDKFWNTPWWTHSSKLQEKLKDGIEKVKNGRIVRFEATHVGKDGEEITVDFSLRPVRNEDGKIVSLIASGKDITERKRAEQRLEMAMSAGEIAFWDWDIKEDKVEFDEKWEKMIGYSLNELRDDINVWKNLIHPEDIEMVEEELEKHLSGEKELYEVIPRVETKNGELRYFMDTGKVVEWDENGNPERFIGILIDATERMETEERKNFLTTLLRQDLGSKTRTIQGYLQLIKEGTEISEKYKEYLEKSIKASREADEILSLAKKLEEIEKTEWTDEKDITKVLEFVIKTISDSSKGKKVEIEKNYPESLGNVEGDYSLNTLFTQLLMTRIQLGECNKIEINAEEKEEEILLKILDDGKQLPPDVKNLFSGEAYTGETTGVGGVRYYMLREIANHNKVKIEVKDSNLGGARFNVRLKKA